MAKRATITIRHSIIARLWLGKTDREPTEAEQKWLEGLERRAKARWEKLRRAGWRALEPATWARAEHAVFGGAR